RMIFAVSSVNFFLIGLFWVWFIWQNVWEPVLGGETAVSTNSAILPLSIMAGLWFFLAIILWITYIRIHRQDKQT
ncbi:MAG: hypothetical protein GY943_05585, partial [Chloroflexi bacterium]|nr:hypothetical protein [Chloroflexota bacterium]